jgi:hypothetical protein
MERVAIVNLKDASFLCVAPSSSALKMARHKSDSYVYFSLVKNVTFWSHCIHQLPAFGVTPESLQSLPEYAFSVSMQYINRIRYL